MNPSRYTSVGVTAAVLTPMIMWLFDCPLTARTAAQASGMASLPLAAAIQAKSAHRSRGATGRDFNDLCDPRQRAERRMVCGDVGQAHTAGR